MTKEAWGIALDIGYSGVKGMSPNMVFCFPSFARRFSGQTIAFGEPDPDEIQYRDENGAVWFVGKAAQNILASDDSNDSLHSLYGRNRYFSPMFTVLARTGLGLDMMDNEFGDPKDKALFLQTGLPPAYLKSDVRDLKEVLCGHHVFDLRVGGSAWKHFDFELSEDSIRVMAQPMGSLLSAALSNDAKMIPESAKYFNSNVMVFDAGFGTVDIYSVKNRNVESSESYDDLGMKAVLMTTADKIFEKYGVEVPVHAMQKCLREGYVKSFDRKTMRTRNEDFSDILEEATKKVCMDAIERLKQSYNFLLDYDYLLITGGTGAAWQEIISNHFSGMESLHIITGNQNDALSHIFSNVRGYYYYQAGKLISQYRTTK